MSALEGSATQERLEEAKRQPEQPQPEPAQADDHIADPTAEEEEAPLRLNTNPGVADAVFQRLTQTGARALTGKGEIVPRRMRTFILDGQTCAPDVFVDEAGAYYDFEVTMRSLDSREEISALAGTTDPGAVPFLLAKQSLYAINGKAIPGDRKDFLWECLGMGGRQLCLMAFQHLGSASGAALGKFRRSISVG